MNREWWQRSYRLRETRDRTGWTVPTLIIQGVSCSFKTNGGIIPSMHALIPSLNLVPYTSNASSLTEKVASYTTWCLTIAKVDYCKLTVFMGDQNWQGGTSFGCEIWSGGPGFSLQTTPALMDIWQDPETSLSKSSLGNFQLWYLADML